MLSDYLIKTIVRFKPSIYLCLVNEMNKNRNLPKPYIHSDVFTSMTGFTRFLYENEKLGWRYNRTENMTDPEYLVYTHLFSDRNDYEGF